ncbi:hypothetical protein [Haliangium ochraceum]|uniref:Uncharacterized protein n=1 Tax=Haliangium ochraceum (strain DSM 14365 / JCM 11303 / SMP-2) TaxID=502025 RepID=D0LVT2_HALO1|nr:hypothetical protein [Haliangium ochraceum]ACY14066.1 hypothetical protein Hoch_1514 [Haliangium ochraceum DSM 14365]
MNENRQFEFHALHELQRRVARNDARLRILFGGALGAALVALLIWAPVALSEPDSPFSGVFDDMYHFSPNTPAVADEINSNFARLRSLDVENAEAIANLAVSPVDGERLLDATITANKLADNAVDAQVRDYIREKCFIFIGWRDHCNNCDTTPSWFAKHRVGRTSNGCDDGAGERTCKGGWAGVGTSGDVDGNDQFYVRLQCD